MQNSNKIDINAEQNSQIGELLKAVEKLSAKVCAGGKSMLTLEEAAAYLGLKESSLLTLTSSEQISFYKPKGKLIYFDRDDLDKWLRRGYHPEKAD